MENIEEEIKNDIHLNAWNPKIKAFTQSYGSDFLDALFFDGILWIYRL